MNSASDRALPSAAAIADVAGVTDVEVGDGGDVLVADSDPGCGTARARLFSPAGAASEVLGGCGSPLTGSLKQLTFEGDEFLLVAGDSLWNGSVATPRAEPLPLSGQAQTDVGPDSTAVFGLGPDGTVSAIGTTSVIHLITRSGATAAHPFRASGGKQKVAAASLAGPLAMGALEAGTKQGVVLWPSLGGAPVATITSNDTFRLGGERTVLRGFDCQNWHLRRSALVAFAGVALVVLAPEAGASPDGGPRADVGPPLDAGGPMDAGVALDAAGGDAATPPDAAALRWLTPPPSVLPSHETARAVFSLEVPSPARVKATLLEPTAGCSLSCSEPSCDWQMGPGATAGEVVFNTSDPYRESSFCTVQIEAEAPGADPLRLTATIALEGPRLVPLVALRSNGDAVTSLQVHVANSGLGHWPNPLAIEVRGCGDRLTVAPPAAVEVADRLPAGERSSVAEFQLSPALETAPEDCLVAVVVQSKSATLWTDVAMTTVSGRPCNPGSVGGGTIDYRTTPEARPDAWVPLSSDLVTLPANGIWVRFRGVFYDDWEASTELAYMLRVDPPCVVSLDDGETWTRSAEGGLRREGLDAGYFSLDLDWRLAGAVASRCSMTFDIADGACFTAEADLGFTCRELIATQTPNPSSNRVQLVVEGVPDHPFELRTSSGRSLNASDGEGRISQSVDPATDEGFIAYGDGYCSLPVEDLPAIDEGPRISRSASACACTRGRPPRGAWGLLLLSASGLTMVRRRRR